MKTTRRLTPRRRARTLAQIKAAGTTKQREEFLDRLAESPSVSRACALSRFPRRSAYDLRQSDSVFAKAWDAALILGDEALEDEALRRAQFGVTRPVFQGGKKVGVVQEYSDTLLMFTLKKRKPEFRDAPSVQVNNISLEKLILQSLAPQQELPPQIINSHATALTGESEK